MSTPDDATTGDVRIERDDQVPKLPRGRGLKLSTGQLIRIAVTATLLVLLVLMEKPCSDAVSRFVTGFGDQGSAAMPKPGNVDVPAKRGSDYERLRPNMTEAEIKAAVDRARARNAPDGSATPPPSPSP